MKQLGEYSILDYMTRQAVVVDDTARLTEAIRIMESEKLSALPVVNEQSKLVGILSASDLIEITHEIQSDISALHLVSEKSQEFLLKLLIDHGENTLVNEVMTSPVVAVTENTNMVIAAQLILERRCHHLPVVDEKGAAIGIISTTDFVRAFAEHSAALAG